MFSSSSCRSGALVLQSVDWNHVSWYDVVVLVIDASPELQHYARGFRFAALIIANNEFRVHSPSSPIHPMARLSA